MVLSVSGIRQIASDYGYEEIELNTTSRVISFRRQTTRINVYYTTGTVGTCLNHPSKGKTQLFRRNVTRLDALERIFDNPRIHTGDGYYTRKNIAQQWKNEMTNETLADSVRRWMFVGAATGIVQNDRERKVITDICTKWDALTWNPGQDPHPKKTRYNCGSGGAMMLMMYEIMQETSGDFYVCSSHDVNDYHDGKRGEPEDQKGEGCCGLTCDKYQTFMENHTDDLKQLQRQFMSLRKELRIELVHWFLTRQRQDFYFTDMNFRPIAQTKYHHQLHFAHIEYGQTNYPKKQGLCDHCGVLLNYSNG